jgi:hypothetical protein
MGWKDSYPTQFHSAYLSVIELSPKEWTFRRASIWVDLIGVSYHIADRPIRSGCFPFL